MSPPHFEDTHMNQTQPTTHVFAHLGPAPYRFEGVAKNLLQHADGSTQPGGSCDHCGTGLLWEFHLVAADGRAFKVGSSCIAKAGDAGLRRVVTDHQRAQREVARVAAAAARAARPKSAEKLAWEARQAEALVAREAAQAARARALAAKLDVLADVLRALDAEADAEGVYESFHASLARQLRADGSLSPRQAGYALRLVHGRRSARNADAFDAAFEAVTTRLS
jgi:ribosome-binding protein aMBF1 (putative translation factor)